MLTAHARNVLEERVARQTAAQVHAPLPKAGTKVAVSGGSSLLERVRAREASKMAAGMQLDVATQRKQAALSRLPEAARSLWAQFLAEARPALPRDQVLAKLCSGTRGRSMSAMDAEETVALLMKHAPQWITEVTLSKGKYIRLDKTADFNAIRDSLRQLAQY